MEENRILNFCTLFDRNYLYKGLALYNSLDMVCNSFKLFALCFDDITYNTLAKMKLDKLQLISLKEFEDSELLNIKSTRLFYEYYWTCTPSLPLYILEKYPELEMVTYLDADLYFYSSPLPIFKEFGNNSILMIKHNYSDDYYKYQAKAGIYNVECLTFRNDDNAKKCLAWWRKRCIDWCYYRYEKGKWGDQKYLEEWIARFKGVHVLQYKGGGVAPWNVQKYDIGQHDGKITVDGNELIFYHFNQFMVLGKNRFYLVRDYAINQKAVDLIYKPYASMISGIMESVRGIDSGFNYGVDTEIFSKTSFLMNSIKLAMKNRIVKYMFRKFVGKLFGKRYLYYEIKDESN